MTHDKRTGGCGRKRNGTSSGALCVGVGKKSRLSFIHLQLENHYQMVDDKKKVPSGLNLSPNSIDLRFRVIQPPGQTTQKSR
jgi:hypothetical protein